MNTAQAALESALSLATLHGEPIAIAIADGSGRCLASSRGGDADWTFETQARALAETSARTRQDSATLRSRRAESRGGTAVPENATVARGTSLLIRQRDGADFAVAARATSADIERACAERAVQMLDHVGTSKGRPASADLRQVMGSFVTGVIVAIAKDPVAQGPVGFTATGLVSLSLEPPLVGLSVGHAASSHPAFVQCTDFTVSVLHSGQSDLAIQLARSGPEKFSGVDLIGTAQGGWRLHDASATFSARTRNTLRTGDHTLIIGEVYEARLLTERPVLLFFGGGRFGKAEPRDTAAVAI
ncbi:flavin reductase family protein [Actinomadura macra]|uniref:flavin reductase family protein n=1 Tax=Actinomadura macra TaxID=46164 RepID=UPI00082CA062|nr:flavin reductase [Actinomadura macra]